MPYQKTPVSSELLSNLVYEGFRQRRPLALVAQSRHGKRPLGAACRSDLTLPLASSVALRTAPAPYRRAISMNSRRTPSGPSKKQTLRPSGRVRSSITLVPFALMRATSASKLSASMARCSIP